MIKIYKVVRKIFLSNKDKWSEDKIEGFKECLMYFLTGIESHVAINVHIELEEVNKILKSTREELRELKTKNINHELQKELDEANAKIKALKLEMTANQESSIKKNTAIERYKKFIRYNNMMYKYDDFLKEEDKIKKPNNNSSKMRFKKRL